MHLSGVRLSVLSSRRTPLLRMTSAAVGTVAVPRWGWVGGSAPPQMVASPPNLAILDTVVN